MVPLDTGNELECARRVAATSSKQWQVLPPVDEILPQGTAGIVDCHFAAVVVDIEQDSSDSFLILRYKTGTRERLGFGNEQTEAGVCQRGAAGLGHGGERVCEARVSKE